MFWVYVCEWLDTSAAWPVRMATLY